MKIADYILIGILATLSLIFLGFQVLTISTNDLAAIVRYGNERILVINLDEINDKSVTVLKDPKPQIIIEENQGQIILYKESFPMLVADMTIEFKHNSIRVEKEESPLNICSKQGWISDSLIPIICLPNKITIDIVKQKEVADIISRPPSIEM